MLAAPFLKLTILRCILCLDLLSLLELLIGYDPEFRTLRDIPFLFGILYSLIGINILRAFLAVNNNSGIDRILENTSYCSLAPV